MNLEDQEEVREQVLDVLAASPRDYGHERNRWRLVDLLPRMDGLAVNSVSGLWHVWHRLDIRFRRGWAHVVSPDPERRLKLSLIEHIRRLAHDHPQQIVALWLDELTVYRLPSKAPTWGCARQRPGKARHTPGEDDLLRIGAVLNEHSGQVTYRMAQTFGARQLCALYRTIRQTYPDAEHIYVIQDCWPAHLASEVFQQAADLDMAIVTLPTYASWRNPIEKLWRYLKQTVIHMHPWADDWPRLQHEVRAFLDRFQQHRPQLLRYVGLSS